MSRDLGELLRDTAVQPVSRPDPADLVDRGRRRRRARRAGVGIGTAAAVTVLTLAVVGPTTSPGPPQIVDQPAPRETSVPDERPEDEGSEGRKSPPEQDTDDRVEQLEARRTALLEQLSDRVADLSQLRGTESDLRFRQEQGEDVATELDAVVEEIAAVRSAIEELRSRQFAVEQELVELGALEDPVAVARAATTDADRALTDALIEFARAPSATALADVPLTDEVALGLADELHGTVRRDALSDPGDWAIDEPVFRAYSGPFSALDLLAQDRPTQTLVGAHPHCASPPVPAPEGFADHRRVSLQPVDGSSCLEWWTVDLFVAGDGRIEAVTLDLWEP